MDWQGNSIERLPGSDDLNLDKAAALIVMGDRLAGIVDNHIVMVVPSDGSIRELSYDAWRGDVRMTFFDGALYIIQSDILHRVTNFDNGSPDPLPTETDDPSEAFECKTKWFDTTGFITMAGYHYILQNTVLHRMKLDCTGEIERFD